MFVYTGKKLSDFESNLPPNSKLSPSSMHPPPPPPTGHHQYGHSPNSLYNRTGLQSHPNPLMPLTMMAKGQSSPNNSNVTSSNSSSNSSSSGSSSNNLLSPVLFSPLSASSAEASHYKRKLGLTTGPSEASEVPSSVGNESGMFFYTFFGLCNIV